jgi:catechol 2,3-dioxygenase-like lactoylglutathione lyase family enzyme
MIDHVNLLVRDYQRSKRFYTEALAPLGYGIITEIPKSVAGVDVAGFGDLATKEADFWISAGEVVHRQHVAFRAKDRSIVKKFYAAALAAGATDNGAPGPRPHYHEHYFGAFARDPDGHNIEACAHQPE